MHGDEGTTFPEGKEKHRKNKGHVDSWDTQIHVSRPAYSAPQLRSSLGYFTRVAPRVNVGSRVRACCASFSPRSLWALLLFRVPILTWLPRYKFKRDFVPDLITGLTVGVMHLPQGMGYAMLAEVPPIIGLYTAVFPVLIYTLLGTSRHISMGTFAVGCLMTGKIVVTYASPTPSPNATGLAGNTTGMPGADEVFFSHTQVATAAAFMVGAWQTLFAVLQLGKISVFLPDMIVSGFTTGAACHVFSSQAKNIFGLKLQRHDGPFYLIFLYIDIFKSLPKSNVAVLIMSGVSLVVLGFNSEVVKPFVRKFTMIPIPVDLFAIIIGTTLTYVYELDKTYGIIVVGDVPRGLPAPIFPDHRLFVRLLVDSFVLAVIIYVICFSMAKIFSKKHGYKINSTQELYAGGLSNLFASFFSVVPSCASLPRSMVQETVGGKTQLVSLISCCVVVIVLLFIGPAFNTLPTCVLASIIVVALKGLFLQVFDCVKMWKLSKGDAMLWMVTFLTTVLVDVEYGLAVGVLINIVLLLKRNNQPTVTKLGWVPKTDMYVDEDSYQSAVSVPGFCLCRVTGSLNSVTIDHFREQLLNATGIDTTLITTAKLKREKKERKRAALENLSTDEGVTSTPQEEGVDRRGRDQIITIHNSSQDMKSQKIKEELANMFRGNNSNYACINGQQAGVDKRNLMQGHENGAFHPDDLQVTYSELKAPSGGLQKRFANSSKGVLPQDVSFLVLCMSGVGLVDVMAAKDLGVLYKEHEEAEISLSLAGTNDAVMQVLRQCGVLDIIPEDRFYYSLHDAVTTLVAEVLGSKPQPSPFVGDMDCFKGPPPANYDARPPVLPPMHPSHALRFPNGVPVPTQLRAIPMEKYRMEGPADEFEYYQAQRNFAQPPRHKKGENAEFSKRKRSKDPRKDSYSPTSELNIQPRDSDYNTRF